MITEEDVMEQFYRWIEEGYLDEHFTRFIMETLTELRWSRAQKSG